MQLGTKRGWKWVTRGLVGALAVAGLAGGVFAYRNGRQAATPAPAKTTPKAVTVTVEPVTPRPVRRFVAVVGSLWGRDEVAISPKVEGRIIKIHHDVGDVVKPGDVLLEIDPVDFELAVAETRRALELELAKLGLKEQPGKEFDVRTLPAVVRAAARERNAVLQLDRMARLSGTGGASSEEREKADTDHKVAVADSKQAVLEAEATLAAARFRQAALATALQRLRDTKVVVPGSGDTVEYVVCQRGVSEGEMVRVFAAFTNTNLFKLIIDRPLKLQAPVPERYRGAIKVGQDAILEVEAFPGETFTGKVARVNPSVDRASRTFQVEIHVPNTDRRLSPGSFAKVAILTKVDPSARTVPEEAVVSFAGVTKVFTIEGGKARAVPIRLGKAVEEAVAGKPRTWMEVEGDLPAGAPVVTSGQSQLADGTPVRIRGMTKDEARMTKE